MTDAYSISRLLVWRGRAFDLSDECDWLDALDDFGTASLRFLIDERHVTAIPGSDGALAAMKRSLAKTPLASLKPTRGSVWILFAFRDDLQGLPPPFRQDGVLPPFVWTRETQNGRTPRRLRELAERVKGQLGAAADWSRSCA